jgi:hypothetical protein
VTISALGLGIYAVALALAGVLTWFVRPPYATLCCLGRSTDGKHLNYEVRLFGGSTENASVDVFTEDRQALSEKDYELFGDRLYFEKNERRKAFKVNLLEEIEIGIDSKKIEPKDVL